MLIRSWRMVRTLPKRTSTAVRSDTATVTAGSVFSRLSILILYFVAARSLARADYAFLAYIVGVATFLQIILDPNSLAAFVVTKATLADDGERRALLRCGVKLMRLAGLATIGVPVLIALAVSGKPLYMATAASVGFIASGESIARFVRTDWQMDRRFRHYASLDVLLGLGRLTTGFVLVLTGNLSLFIVANLVVGLLWQMLPWVVHATRKAKLQTAEESMLNMARQAWPYSASYLSASIYSNGPAVIVGLFGGVAQGALYTIVSRMTQPTELVPQALLAVNLPMLTAAGDDQRPSLFRRQAIQAGSAGLAVALLLVVTGPLTLRLFRLPLGEAFPLLVVLAAILPLKFLSYQFVALVMAEGNIRARLRASAFVATLSVVGVCAVAWAGALPAALVTLACECLLVTLLYQAGKGTAHTAFFESGIPELGADLQLKTPQSQGSK